MAYNNSAKSTDNIRRRHRNDGDKNSNSNIFLKEAKKVSDCGEIKKKK
jgi:hypothetical protein